VSPLNPRLYKRRRRRFRSGDRVSAELLIAARVLWDAGYDTLLIAEAIGTTEAAVYNSLSIARDEENARGAADREGLEKAQEHQSVQGYVYPTYPKVDDKPQRRRVDQGVEPEDPGNGA
jgi:hypothetical protein